MRPLALVVRLCFAIALFAFSSALAPVAAADGRALLEVKGAEPGSGDGGVVNYDLAALEALGTHEVVTETPWTDGPVSFRGVLARDLMAEIGVTMGTVFAVALNDYTVEIPVSDFFDYDVILAVQRDGEYLTVRNRGPLWVIYPWSDVAGLQNELYYSRSIWQLRRIEVKAN